MRFPVFLALAFFPQEALAQSLETLEARLREHPALAAHAFEAEAAKARSRAATALPDPVVSFGVNNLPVTDPAFDRFLPTNKAVGVRQDIPNLAGRRARAEQAEAMAGMSKAAEAARFDALRAELIGLLHEKRRIDEERKLTEARAEKYDRLTDVATAEISGGRPAVFRLAEIEAERAGVARQLAVLEAEEAEVGAALTGLVGFIPKTPPPAVEVQSWSGDPAAFHAVQIERSAIDRAESAVREARAAFRPDWGAQLTYQQREEGAAVQGADFAGDDWVSGTVTVSVPLWAGRSQRPRLLAAKADEAAARSSYLAAARQARAQYETLRSRIKSTGTQIRALEAQVAAVEDEIAAQLRAYESGAGDYAPIIDGEITLLRLRADIVREEARAARATARLNSLLVTP